MGAFTKTFGNNVSIGALLNLRWILLTGIWKDNFRWDDTVIWIDNI